MKIISKRGRKPAVEVTELDVEFSEIGIIVIGGHQVMTPEEIANAERAMRELRRQLEELGRIMDTGWYNLPKRP